MLRVEIKGKTLEIYDIAMITAFEEEDKELLDSNLVSLYKLFTQYEGKLIIVDGIAYEFIGATESHLLVKNKNKNLAINFVEYINSDKNINIVLKDIAKQVSQQEVVGFVALRKFYDSHGRIKGYRITDGNRTMDISSEQIKQLIISGKLSIKNLRLRRDGRLYMTELKH